MIYYCQPCVQKIYEEHRTAKDRWVCNEDLQKAGMPFGQKFCTHCGQEMEWPEIEPKPLGHSDGSYATTAAVYPKIMRKM